MLAKVDLIVNEFLEILVNDIQDDATLALGLIPDEDEFDEKFPFKQEIEEKKKKEEEEKRLIILPSTSAPSPVPKAKVDKIVDIAREKYEKALKELQ